MREDFFSKFKDYNKELEKILENKDFSKDVKNLLLSMFYKVEISYNDYFLVKRKSKTKQEYLENILENIKACNSIELIKPNDTNFEIIKENGLYEINLKLKIIKVLENEIAILAALLELNNFEIHLKEEYNLIRNSMPYLLNMAYDMENIEVIRDFNAWSWNTLVEEIEDVNVNLVYQNLKISLNTNIFTNIGENDIDVVNQIEQILLKLYNQEITERFLELIFKISIIIYIDISENERKRLLEEKENLELDLNEIENKKVYIEKITEQKKQLTTELKNIDLTINNKDLLLKEYEKRNEKVAEYNKIFSLSHLVEKMQRERDAILNKITLCNKKMHPKTYIETINKLQKDYNLLQDVNFKKHNDIYKYIDKLQEIFIKEIFIEKIKAAITKDEIIDCVYQLRYYNFLPYNKEKIIKDVENLKEYIEEAKEILIKKLYDNRIINTISTNEKNDIKIVKNIFDLKIINMEYIYIGIRKDGEKYIISTYDEKETLETEFEMNLVFNKKDKIKLKKKVKLFI